MSKPWIALNVSRMDDYARCPMFYHWRHEAKKVPPTRTALGFGTSIHEPIATWYQTFEIDKVLTKFWETFEAQEGLDPELGTYGERLVKGYCLRWADDPEQFSVEAVEQRLVADLEDGLIGLRLIGRPDLIARTRIGQDRLWHIQHKTCAANTSYDRYVAAYNLNWHERAYAILGWANGFDIQGTVLNLIRKTKQVHTQAGDEHTFKREYIPLGVESIEKFKRDALTMAWRIYSEAGNRPENPRSCYAYNTLCPYHALCSDMPVWDEEFEVTPKDYVDEEEERMNATR